MRTRHVFTVENDHTVLCHVINRNTGREDLFELIFQEEGETYTFLLKKNGAGIASTRDLIRAIGDE
jgi:hypothetical protein